MSPIQIEIQARLKEATAAAARIVENMLSFSRKSESECNPANICKLLDKTVEIASSEYDLKKTYDFKSIEINRAHDEDMPAVMCDRSKMQQVFLNMLKNGAQAMADERSENKKPCFTLRVMNEKGMARIEIEDNGPGMDEDTKKRIFEPFFTTKGVSFGTGLGLSVSYFIITENHHGTLEVESTTGVGTRFIIKLPVKN